MTSLTRKFFENANRHPDRTFIHHGGDEITYGEAVARVSAVADTLRARGVAKGDRVGLICGNRPEFIYVWFGAARLGAVTVPINPNLLAWQYGPMLARAGVRIVATGVEQVEWRGDIAEVEDLTSGAPTSRRDIDDAGEPSAIVSILHTSGTTGRPKGVLIPNNSYVATAAFLADALELDRDDRILLCLPLHHANPQFYGVATAAWIGASVALAERFSASHFWADAASSGATAFTYVGSVLAILHKTWAGEAMPRSAIRRCLGGGAPVYAWEWLRGLGIDVHELYGMTETGAIATINRHGAAKLGSCGRARPDMDVAIVDDGDHVVTPGEWGEIVVRPNAPYVLFSGYDGMPEETVETYANCWLHTGDLGHLDEEGFLFFGGRKNHVIRRGGENISPAEIENALVRFEGVDEVAAVGVPDEILGEEIKVVVVPRPGFDVAAFRTFARAELPRFMHPSFLELRESLPKTETEKVIYAELRDGAAELVDLRL